MIASTISPTTGRRTSLISVGRDNHGGSEVVGGTATLANLSREDSFLWQRVPSPQDARPLRRIFEDGPVRALRRVASVLTTPLAPEDFISLVNPLASTRQLRGIVTKVVPETTDSATIHFRPGKGWNAHEAGQWARIVEIDGVRQWRSYSLSAPAGADPAITVTAIGFVSIALVRDTKPGDVLFLDVPQGDFVLPRHPRPLLMLTAGSGLTPVMSMIRTLVPRRPDADVVLIHSSLHGRRLSSMTSCSSSPTSSRA